MIRPFNSSYDRRFMGAHQEAVEALENAGHTVEQPVTGSIIINGREYSRAEWDGMLTWGIDDILDEIENA